MSWQDAVLAAGQVVFILALLPALLAAREKPPRSSCLVTAVTLFVCSFALGTLELWWSWGAMAVTGGCWLALYFQPRET